MIQIKCRIRHQEFITKGHYSSGALRSVGSKRRNCYANLIRTNRRAQSPIETPQIAGQLARDQTLEMQRDGGMRIKQQFKSTLR
jgi:hypothetical protein